MARPMPERKTRNPRTSSGRLLAIRWSQPACSSGAKRIPNRPSSSRGRTPSCVEPVAEQGVHELDHPEQHHEADGVRRRAGPARPALARVVQPHHFTVSARPSGRPSTARRRDRRRSRPAPARGPGPSPARRSPSTLAHSSCASSTSMPASESEGPSLSRRPRSASNAAARSSRCPGAFSVRQALPLPTARHGHVAPPRGRWCERTAPRRACRPPPPGARRPAAPACRPTIDDRPRLDQPRHSRAAGRPQLGHRVLEAGVLRQQRERPRHEDHPAHCSPRIARRGGRRPAIDDTMSTTCRVSTTSWTR